MEEIGFFVTTTEYSKALWGVSFLFYPLGNIYYVL